MLRYALLAIGAAIVLALVFVLLPTGGGPRPDPRILANGDQPPSTSFTIRDAAPPAPADPAPPAAAADLDAVMQRLRSGGAAPAPAQDTPAPAAQAGTPSAPATPALPLPVTPVPATQAGAPDPASPPAAPRFPTVTSQGTHWRMARAGNGFTISIDMGDGHVADVHVLPAFANLDPAAINVRVDYLRETILQHFPHQSGAYSFARDGSVSLER